MTAAMFWLVTPVNQSIEWFVIDGLENLQSFKMLSGQWYVMEGRSTGDQLSSVCLFNP